MDDTQAIQRLKNGDIGGLELLISRYQEKAVHTAYLITHDLAAAEDVVQETFVRVYQRIRYFDETKAFEPYFLRSVMNSALNAAEKTSRNIPLSEAVEPGMVESLLNKGVTTENQVEYSQLKREISDALTKLPPRERAVIIERYFLEMSEKEMAARHSMPPGTIKWLLNVARRRLRTLIGMEGDRS
jgi:RNA polymerase sigma-70 factor (ECF subfamily)